MELKLTGEEESIFELLVEVVQLFNLKTEVRVVGGWVRDKVLGIADSLDIDITLENMESETYCGHLKHLLATKGQRVKLTYCPRCTKVTFRNVDLDFSRLRGNSVQEDAKFRDMTINSLFYNIRTGLVEDPTGRGLTDLENKLLVPPTTERLDETYIGQHGAIILRTIRLSAELDFDIDRSFEELFLSRTERLIKSLPQERVGSEVRRMLLGKRPLHAMEMLNNFGVFPLVFRAGEKIQLEPDWVNQCIKSLQAALAVLEELPEGFCKLDSESSRECFLLSVLLLPLRSLKLQRDQGLVSRLIKDMRLANKLKSHILSVQSGAEVFHAKLIDLLQSDEDWLTKRVEAGVAVLTEFKDVWREALALASCLKYPELPAKERSGICRRVAACVEEFELDKVEEVSGLEFKEAFGYDDCMIGQARKDAIKWQLEHPRSTKAEWLSFMLNKTI